MYWIKVYFANGKTLKKESTNVNDSYKIYCRYVNSRVHNRVCGIVAGYDSVETLRIDTLEKIVN